jgi:hypothetical protein
VWSSVSKLPCKHAEERLEVRARLGCADHGGRMMRTRRPGKWCCYQEVQGVEARLVVRPASSRCTGVLGISCRSSFWRRRDSDADALTALKIREGRNHVRELCEIEVEGVVQRREARAYYSSGISWLSVAARQPLVRAAWRQLARVLGRGECGRRGSLYRHV